jgi:uncharacterized lipoprotein YajG
MLVNPRLRSVDIKVKNNKCLKLALSFFKLKNIIMKKFIFPLVTFLLLAGMANAQKKDSTKTMATKHVTTSKTATAKKATTSSTSAVSPSTTKTTNTAGIKRKHHKKKKPVVKKG